MELEVLLTTYGPLALGWVFAVYLLKVNTGLQERVMTAFLADTQAKSSLEATLDKLIERLDHK